MSSYDFDDHSRDDDAGRPGSGAVKLAAVFAALCIAGMGGLWLFGTFNHQEPSELLLFLGRFHPLIVHLPIGGLVLIFTLEVISLLTARTWKPRTLGPLVFTALASVAAVVCGYLLGGEFTEPEVLWHFRWALIFTALIWVTLTLRVASARGGAGAGLLSAITMLGSVAALSIAGHLGATITHGPTYMTQYAPASIKPTMERLLGLEPREDPADDDDTEENPGDDTTDGDTLGSMQLGNACQTRSDGMWSGRRQQFGASRQPILGIFISRRVAFSNGIAFDHAMNGGVQQVGTVRQGMILGPRGLTSMSGRIFGLV